MPRKKPTKKVFFKSDIERNLWVHINAELVQYTQKVVNGVEKELGNINIQYSPIWVSNNQLIYDEHECDAPRFSLEELLISSIPELFKISCQREEEETRKMFEECERERNNNTLGQQD
jgi:hypothetical protein